MSMDEPESEAEGLAPHVAPPRSSPAGSGMGGGFSLQKLIDRQASLDAAAGDSSLLVPMRVLVSGLCRYVQTHSP